jgi:hypothetical protein
MLGPRASECITVWVFDVLGVLRTSDFREVLGASHLKEGGKTGDTIIEYEVSSHEIQTMRCYHLERARERSTVGYC